MSGRKAILIIGAGPGQLTAIKRAKEMGLYVAAADFNPTSPGFAYADEHSTVSTKDIEALTGYARDLAGRAELKGVMTCGAEVAVSVAEVAKSLGLPGISPETAFNASNKLMRSRIFKECGIPAPEFRSVTSKEEVMNIKDSLSFPLVIKPTDKAGALGVIKCSSLEELLDRMDETFSVSGDGTLLIEEYLEGPQISTEAIVYEGKIYTTGFADRNYECLKDFEPYFIEDGHTIPSNLTEDMKSKVIKVTEGAVKALGIDWGVAKGDVIIHNGVPKVFEMVPRLSGGRFATDMVPLATGVDIVRALIKLSIGETINIENELMPRFNKGAAQRFFLHKGSGVLKKLEGVEEAAKSPGVYDLEFDRSVKPGDFVDSIKSHHGRILHVIAEGATREEAVRNAQCAVARVGIEFG